MGHLLNESPELEARARALAARQLLAAQQLCSGLAEAGLFDAGAEDIEMLALQMIFTTTCRYSFKPFKRPMPGRKPAACGDSALAAYCTLSLLAPFVAGESRDYLNFMRAKYLK